MLKQNSGDKNCLGVVSAIAFNVGTKALRDYIKHEPPFSETEFMQFALSNGFLVGFGGVSGTKLLNEAKEYLPSESGLIDVTDSESRLENATINHNITFKMNEVKALLIVKKDSELDHAVFWDGTNVYDPNPSVGIKKLSDYEILRFYPIFEP